MDFDSRPIKTSYFAEKTPKKEEKIEQVHAYVINEPTFDAKSEVSDPSMGNSFHDPSYIMIA